MEYAPNGDLRSRLEGGALPPAEAMRLASQVTSGLETLHQVGIVHRDIKPANVLLVGESEPTAKISDFILTDVVGPALDRSSTTVGTPLYMARECAATDDVGAPADVYSLGVVLCELLNGNPPFPGPGLMAIVNAHVHTPPPRLTGHPEPLADLVDQMLAKEPSLRPIASDVERRLRSHLAGGQADSRPSQPERDVAVLELVGEPSPATASAEPEHRSLFQEAPLLASEEVAADANYKASFLSHTGNRTRVDSLGETNSPSACT